MLVDIYFGGSTRRSRLARRARHCSSTVHARPVLHRRGDAKFRAVRRCELSLVVLALGPKENPKAAHQAHQPQFLAREFNAQHPDHN